MSDSPLKFKPQVANAPLYQAGKSIKETCEAYGLEESEVIKMASNESPLAPSEKVMAAIKGAVGDLNRYPPVTADELHEALAAYYGEGLTGGNFLAGNGASELIDVLARGFIEPGDNIVICRPTFPIYEAFTGRNGGATKYADLDDNNNYAYQVDLILDTIDDKTQIVYLCSPNNPTGTLINPEQAERLVAEIPERVLVVFDESYRAFVADRDILIDPVKDILKRPNIATLRSFSKVFGLAGLRAGYIIAAPETILYLRRLTSPFYINILTLAGAKAALQDVDYVHKLRDLVIEERTWLNEQVEALDLEVIQTHTNFVTIKTRYPAQTVFDRLQCRGIITRPLAFFYMPYWFRVTVGTREQNERFIEILKEELQGMAAEGVSTELPKGDGTVSL